MAKRITPGEHVVNFFMLSSFDDCETARDRINLIMRVRFPDKAAPPKRGRKPSKKPGPLATEAAS